MAKVLLDPTQPHGPNNPYVKSVVALQNAIKPPIVTYTQGLYSKASLDQVPLLDVPGIFIPRGWGNKLKNSLATTGYGNVVVPGDSLSQGFYTSSLRTKSWPSLLAAEGQARYGDGGSGIYSVAHTSLLLGASGVNIPAPALTSYQAVADDLIQLTGTWTGQQGSVGGWQGIVTTDVATPASATWTYKMLRGRYIDIQCFGFSSTAIQYSIDGGSFQSLAIGSGFKFPTIDAGSGGNHSLTIRTNNAAALTLGGVRGHNSTGFVVDNYSMYGQRAASVDNLTSSKPCGAIAGGALTPAAAGGPAQVALYSLLANDLAQATTASAFGSSITGWLNGMTTSIYGGTPNAPDIAFIMMPVGKFDSATTPGRATLKSNILSLCRSEGYAYIDLQSIPINAANDKNSWDNMNALGYLGNSSAVGTSGTDNIHLSDAGSAWLYSQIRRLFVETQIFSS